LQRYFEDHPLPASAVTAAIGAFIGGAWVFVTPGGSLAFAVATGVFLFVTGTLGMMTMAKHRLRRRAMRATRSSG
jgi:hypothetical protein